MEYPNLSEEHMCFLISAAVQGKFPRNVLCPNRCRFCYEADFSKMFPWIKTILIPPFTKESFDFYQEACRCLERQKGEDINKDDHLSMPLEGNSPYILTEKSNFTYHPRCDFFCLGLSHKQIEVLVKKEKIAGRVLRVSTTGLHADAEFIKYLSKKYPDTLRLHLSIITFDSAIRRSAMNSHINIENLKTICSAAVEPTYVIMCFNEEQIFSDIKMLNESSIKTKGTFLFLKLYHNKLSPKDIADYAIKGEKLFKKIVFNMKMNNKKLKYISTRSFFCPNATIYAWRWRKEIKDLLFYECKGTEDEAVFCSRGAYKVIKNMIKGKTHVLPIDTAFKGNIDFTLGMNIKDIISKIRKKQMQGMLLKKIFIPSAMFFFKNDETPELSYDLYGDNINLIKETFPAIDVNVIQVPDYILNSVVSLEDCISYYER